ncbi:hypothetical protein LEP1GSC082_1525 [Leptospira kirschneri str. H2]|nr:hypothetical protein LEP1GSC082_1525 [Leptospira kirschneri str. H2]
MPILSEAFAEFSGSFEVTKASHSPWVVRSNSASHSPWVVRSNSASHSPWVVRQVAFETQQNAFYESVLGSIN